MKIAVYTIAKNEEKYAARWAKSAEGADYRVVLDTGSSDATVSILRESGVEAHQALVEPWRLERRVRSAPRISGTCAKMGGSAPSAR